MCCDFLWCSNVHSKKTSMFLVSSIIKNEMNFTVVASKMVASQTVNHKYKPVGWHLAYSN